MKLDGKTALVTGGGTGIGYGIAKGLADEGAKVVITGRRQEKLEEARQAMGGEDRVVVYACDVADRASVKSMYDWLSEQSLALDILVNSAGTNIPNRLMGQMEPEQFDEIMQINNTGVYNCMYYALPGMRAKKDGLIVNISSISGKRAYALGGVAYCASKFAVAGLSSAVANEDNANGIRVTTIYPGEVDTPILEKRPSAVTDEHRATMVQPEDFAGVVNMLAMLPARAHIPELIIKPTVAEYV